MYTDPNDVDTDGDLLTDTEEGDYGTDPLVADNDADGLLDGLEVALGLDIDNPNSDGDRFNDGEEIERDTDPFVFDVTLADRTRALAAGAVLGELGYALASFGVDVTLSVLWIPTPTVVPGVGFLNVCDIPFSGCTELLEFRPLYLCLLYTSDAADE